MLISQSYLLAISSSYDKAEENNLRFHQLKNRWSVYDDLEIQSHSILAAANDECNYGYLLPRCSYKPSHACSKMLVLFTHIHPKEMRIFGALAIATRTLYPSTYMEIRIQWCRYLSGEISLPELFALGGPMTTVPQLLFTSVSREPVERICSDWPPISSVDVRHQIMTWHAWFHIISGVAKGRTHDATDHTFVGY
jgi:hypothetical protein